MTALTGPSQGCGTHSQVLVEAHTVSRGSVPAARTLSTYTLH